MKSILVATLALALAAPAHAAITASVDGGTSFIHLGKLSNAECQALVTSPAAVNLNLSVDGHSLSADEVRCRNGIAIDLVTTEPKTTMSSTEITQWPLDRGDCIATATKVLKGNTIHVNGVAIDKPEAVGAACSKSSNTVSVAITGSEQQTRP